MNSTSPVCVVSRQNVTQGKRCVLLPLIQRASIRERDLSHNGYCVQHFSVASHRDQVNSFWSPFGGFIEAIYEGDEQFRLAESKVNLIRMLYLLNTLQRLSLVTESGPNPELEPAYNLSQFLEQQTPLLREVVELVVVQHKRVPDIRIVRDELRSAWEYLFGMTQNFRVFAFSRIGNIRPVQFAVVSGGVFDELMAFGIERVKREAAGLGIMLNRLRMTAAAYATNASSAYEAWHAELRDWETYADRLHGGALLPFPSESLELALLPHAVSNMTTTEQFANETFWLLQARYVFAGLATVGAVLGPISWASDDSGKRFRQLLANVQG